MMQPQIPDIENFLKGYWRSKRGSLVFDYATAVSLCGSLDVLRLIAYDKDHEIYYEAKVNWEELYKHREWAYSAVLGPKVQELYVSVRLAEAKFLSALP